MVQRKLTLLRLAGAVLVALPATATRAQDWSQLGKDWGSVTICAGDVETCDCPGCRAYRARLDQTIVITDEVNAPLTLDDAVASLESVTLAQAAEPIQPLDVSPSLGPTSSFTGSAATGVGTVGVAGVSTPGFADLGFATSPASETVQAALATPGGSVVPAQLASLIAAPESGTIMRDAGSSNTVTLQRRNTVSYDPHVRGFRYAQVLSRVGGVWSPVRQDLDSPISKLDPSLIEDISIIPGPYASRFGPGFSFIDVATAYTPRYNSYESHATIGETFHDNRGRQHGRATVFGGGSDWGFIGHYGSRTGSDYRSGNGTLIPSSYDNQSFVGQLGFDLTPTSNLEVRYDRLDQSDTEYALQFFDIDYLGNDSTSFRYVENDPGGVFSQVLVDGWYNRTRYHGDNLNPSKLPVRQRVINSLAFDFGRPNPMSIDFQGTTFGDRLLTGGRVMGTLGDVDYVHARTGVDYRYEDQFIREDFRITDTVDDFPPVGGDNAQSFYTNLPKSWLHDTGVFQELVLPFSDYWTTTIGARGDVLSYDVRASDVRAGGNLEGDNLSQAETLYSFYLINDVALTSNWSSQFGFGHAQRPPSLVDRYADGVFLGIIQSGFSRIIGDPNIDKERLWQIDWGMSCDYENFRGRGTLFNSWINDFITYSGNIISPVNGRLLTTTNTDLATMAGFELYGEGDVSDYLTLFSAMNYVQGTDQTIDAPLWGIAPLQGRAGMRLHDANRGQTWGAELSLRMVDRQDRTAFIRSAFPANPLIPIESLTPGFSTVDLRTYYNYTSNVSFLMGIENLLDKNYLEHLDLRLQEFNVDTPPPAGFPTLPAEAAFSPGFTFYTGVEIKM